MQDRQKFDRIALKNGMTVYSHAMDVPFFSVHIVIPVGSVHSHTKNAHGVNGVAHFLEHMIFKRSVKYPELLSFEKSASLKGSRWNATTNPFETIVYADAPLTTQQEVLEGLVSQVFYPIFVEEDIAPERGVIANERNQRKYYPGHNELQQYLDTEWQLDRFFTREQLFGCDKDLSAITAQRLTEFHKNYCVPGVSIVVAGGHSINLVCDVFSKIETNQSVLTEHYDPIAWKRREYHERSFKDIESPNLYIGGLAQQFDTIEYARIAFIINLLSNSSHGPIYEWTRSENGWTYGMHGNTSYTHERMTWMFQFPLNDKTPVEQIRAELWPRIEKALIDQDLINKEIERLLNREVFFYQTAEGRIEDAVDSLTTIGRIMTEIELRELLSSMRDISALRTTYEKYFAPSEVGEFLALPETA